jgi:ATP/ADP translocase
LLKQREIKTNMAKNRVKYTLLTRILNINSEEWPRVLICYFIRFFHRFGFVVGWTVLVALVVTNFGIEFLPFLFIANGLLIIFSGFIYSRLIRKFKNSKLIIWTIISAVLSVLIGILLIQKVTLPLFLVLIFAESFFLYQLNTLTSAFVERFFNPLSSQRTFPFIESAETIAILIAGLLIAGLSSHFNPIYFFYIWVLSVALMLPFIILANRLYKTKFKEEDPEPGEEVKGFVDLLAHSIGRIRRAPFLKSLVFIVILQWIFFSLMEFQYTKSVSESIEAGIHIPQVISSSEHSLVHALGTLQVLFGSSALLVQILIGSRIITSLGVVSSLLIYPIVAFLSLFGMAMNFSFITGVFARNNTEITNVIYKNVYHSTFYVLPDSSRELNREFLEGFVKPFAATIAMVAIVFLQHLFTGDLLVMATNAFLILVSILLFSVIISSRKNYTEAAAQILFSENSSFHNKLHAIEILSQKGHKGVYGIFMKALKSEKISNDVKVKIINLVGEFGGVDYLPLILDLINKNLDDYDLIYASLSTLNRYSREEIMHKPITRFMIKDTLDILHKQEADLEMKKLIIVAFGKFCPNLLEILKDENEKNEVKAEVLLAMNTYSDMSIAYYLEPFLESSSPHLRASACVPLWHFHPYKNKVAGVLSRMLDGCGPEIAAAIKAIAELELIEYKKKFESFVKSENQRVSMYAAYALSRFGSLDYCDLLADLLLNGDDVISKEVEKLVKKVPIKVQKHIYRAMRHFSHEKSFTIMPIKRK